MPAEVRGAGAGTGAATAIAPAFPTAEASAALPGDLAFYVAESGGAAALGEATPAFTVASVAPQPGWQETPVGAVQSGNTRLSIYWTIISSTGGLTLGQGETAPGRTSNDTGDHQLGVLFLLKRGTFDPDNPFEEGAGKSTNTQAAGTAVSITGGTTTLAECLIVAFSTGSGDPATTATGSEFSALANANLESLTERVDYRNNIGDGGSILVATGIKKAAGAVGATTTTAATSGTHANAMLAVKPLPTLAAGATPIPIVGEISSAAERTTFGIGKQVQAKEGDICLISLYTQNLTKSPSINQGGKLEKEKVFAGSFRHAILWVRHDGTETQPTLTVAGGENTFCVITYMWYRGCDQSAPIEAISEFAQAAGTSVTTAAIVTKGLNRRVVTSETNSSGFPPTKYPTGVRARLDYSPGIADKVQAAEAEVAGAKYEVGSANLSAVQLALKPASGATTHELKAAMSMTITQTSSIIRTRILKAVQEAVNTWTAKVNRTRIVKALQDMTVSITSKTVRTRVLHAVQSMTMSWDVKTARTKVIKAVMTMSLSLTSKLVRTRVIKAALEMTNEIKVVLKKEHGFAPGVYIKTGPGEEDWTLIAEIGEV